MNFDRLVEAIIKEAQERGDFDNLKGKGQPIDLNGYFETPEDLRMAYSVLKNAGVAAPEIDLLQEIAVLKERLGASFEEQERNRIKKVIREKELQFNLLIERQRRQRKAR